MSVEHAIVGEETTSAAIGGFSSGPSNLRITPGIVKAMTKNGVRSVCKCGFPLPRYPGRYPKACPNCGTPIEVAVKLAAAMVSKVEPDDGEYDDGGYHNDPGGGMEKTPEDDELV